MDTEQPGRPRRRTSIRTKLLVGLAVPVLFVALLSGAQVKRAQDNLNRVREQTDLALAVGGPGEYITAIMDERNISAIDLLGTSGTVKVSRVSSVAQARKVTDAAQKAFEKSLKQGGDQVQAIYGPRFENASKQLLVARKQFDDYHGAKNPLDPEAQKVAGSVYDTYNGFVTGFDTANATAISKIDDAVLRNRAQSIAQQTIVANLASVLSRQGAQTVLQQSELDAYQRSQVAQLLEQYKSARTEVLNGLAGDPAAQKVAAGYFTKKRIQAFVDSTEKLATTGYVGSGPNDITAITENMANAGDPSHPNSSDVWDAGRQTLQHRADALIGAAQASRNRYVAVFFLATLVSVLVALLIARSIAKPLLSIASQADEMATKRLPDAVGSILATPIGQDLIEPELDPITVPSTDEVADVAASINVVQQRALDLAVEQAAQRKNFADTFLNLGRRVQGLVARQLDFITELEDAEDDPDVLGDLFKLDHLATRIRRNAESLVVLAGVTRQQRRGQPAPVVDALRSALSEVDEYPRVDIGQVDDARLPMSVAADVAHILAELIENGLNFSPPDTDVEVVGRLTDRGYEITVSDHGIGMNDDQIATANRRLSGNESFTVAPSRYMGHYVAGHLATGLGIDVAMTSLAKGTKATVLIPHDLLAHTPDVGVAADHEPNEGAGETALPTAPNGSFQPAAPPPAPTRPVAAESLGSLLDVHRRLSRSGPAAEADRSPWAQRPTVDPDDMDSADLVPEDP